MYLVYFEKSLTFTKANTIIQLKHDTCQDGGDYYAAKRIYAHTPL